MMKIDSGDYINFHGKKMKASRVTHDASSTLTHLGSSSPRKQLGAVDELRDDGVDELGGASAAQQIIM